MNLTISVDDGCKSDLRAAKLVEKYELPATFYWPVELNSMAYEKGYKPLTYGDALGISQNHEVGSHTITHRHLTKLSLTEAEIEIEYSKYMMQNLYDVVITKFAPPRGYTNDVLTQFTYKHYAHQRLTTGPGLVHVHPSSGANGNIDWREAYKREALNNDIELWFHSWELDKFNLWEQLDEFLSHT